MGTELNYTNCIKQLMNKRFSNLADIKKRLAELIEKEFKKQVKIEMTDLKDNTEIKDIDFLISCTIYETENDFIDFDLYYAKTRKNEYFILEYILQ